MNDLGVFRNDNKVYLFYNLWGSEYDPCRLAVSRDGLAFRSHFKKPVIFHGNRKENTRHSSNFKISKDKSKYFLLYKNQLPRPEILLAESKNLFNFRIIAEIKNIKEQGMLIPGYRFNNLYVLIFGERNLNLAFSQDLKTWELMPSPLLKAEEGKAVEVGTVMVIERGLLVVYFENQHHRGKIEYCAKAVLLDKNNPTKIIWKSPQSFWEQAGELKNKKIYPLGAVDLDRKLILYFGCLKEGIYAIPSATIQKEGSQDPGQVLKKSENNPIIKPVLKHFWESQAVFNAAAILEDNKVHFVYRAIGDNNFSSLGYASSQDGLTIDERHPKPVYYPKEPFEYSGQCFPDFESGYVSGGGYGGCEDPRLTKIGDRIYMTYVAFNGWEPPRIALTSISVKDFRDKKWNWNKAKLISPPGVVDKNACLFPEKINNKYVFLHRIYPNILIDYVDDLEFKDKKYLEGKYCIKPRNDSWDSRKIGAGAPPIKTKDGWLLIYHAVDDLDPSKYKIGAMVLDLHDPTKVLYRLEKPIIEPLEAYENEGFKSGVVYPCGAVVFDDNLFIYYGGADKVLCAASTNLSTFLQLIHDSHPLSREESIIPSLAFKYND